MSDRIAGEIAALTKWRDFLIECRSRLCQQLLACPRKSPDIPALRLAITRIDRDLDLDSGMALPPTPLDALLSQGGYQRSDWLGSLARVERRLAKLARVRETAAKLASGDQESSRFPSAGVLTS